jgi:hypothetical protein
MDLNVTYYICPPLGSMHAGQARIYMRQGRVSNPRDHCRAHPEQWAEVGLVNFQGKLVCLDAADGIYEEIKACEPLMAGLVFHF